MRKQKIEGKKLKIKVNKKNNGITLIALVITIIVLLILAGVTIATLTGENGILTRASQASEQTEIAEEKEAIGLAYTGILADNNGTGVSADELQEELEKNGYSATVVDNGDGTLTVTFESGREYTIDENGNISDPTISNIIATMKIVGEKVTNPPVPTGFTYTGEGTVDTGYVIQDSNGNEFVWVPVDKDQKIQINVTSKSGNIESIGLTDPYGDEITLPNIDSLGTSYSNTEIDPTINGPYRLTIVAGGETKKVFLNVHSLYEIDTMTDWQTTDGYAKTQGFDTFEELLAGWGYETEEEFLMDGSFMKEYSEPEGNYAGLVKANGGFYIGRYEASESNGSVAIVENVNPWNNIDQITALENTQHMYDSISEEDKNFESSLLTGAAWDRTLGWLYETAAVTSEEIVVNSSSWGNYRDDTFSGTTSLINTGSMPETEKNHIYDLAGNLWEWTTEASGTAYRVSRGRFLRRRWF